MMMIPRKHDFDFCDDVFGDSFFNEGARRLMKMNTLLTLTYQDMTKKE